MNRKISKACEYLAEKHYAEFAPAYGEPGYSDPELGIILADWNNIPRGLADWLEKCGYSLEWSDEWTIHGDKAYRTEPDCYLWECQLILSDDGEWIGPDEGASCAIDECSMTDKGHPARLLPPWVSPADLTDEGFTVFRPDQETGFHPGQTDNPADCARAAFEQGADSVVFRRTEQSQFYVRWECWARFDPPYFDRFDICAAHARIESDYNVGGWVRERVSNQRRNESTAVQLSRMHYRGAPSGDMSPNAWAIYRVLQVRYGFTGRAECSPRAGAWL
jgi:hypothetical protein